MERWASTTCIDRVVALALALAALALAGSRTASAQNAVTVPPSMPALPPSMVEQLSSPLAEVSVRAVTFASGEARLDAAGEAYLRDLAARLSGMRVYVIVEGHTDARGSADANQALSERRASAVRDALCKDGRLAPQQVLAVGYGARVARGTDAADQAKERVARLVLRVAREDEPRRAAIIGEARARGVAIDRVLAVVAGPPSPTRREAPPAQLADATLRLGGGLLRAGRLGKPDVSEDRSYGGVYAAILYGAPDGLSGGVVIESDALGDRRAARAVLEHPFLSSQRDYVIGAAILEAGSAQSEVDGRAAKTSLSVAAGFSVLGRLPKYDIRPTAAAMLGHEFGSVFAALRVGVFLAF
jgi:outer membrane protein OmpA-like peptidoglycan-associated protein